MATKSTKIILHAPGNLPRAYRRDTRVLCEERFFVPLCGHTLVVDLELAGLFATGFGPAGKFSERGEERVDAGVLMLRGDREMERLIFAVRVQTRGKFGLRRRHTGIIAFVQHD